MFIFIEDYDLYSDEYIERDENICSKLRDMNFDIEELYEKFTFNKRIKKKNKIHSKPSIPIIKEEIPIIYEDSNVSEEDIIERNNDIIEKINSINFDVIEYYEKIIQTFDIKKDHKLKNKNNDENELIPQDLKCFDFNIIFEDFKEIFKKTISFHGKKKPFPKWLIN